MGLGFPFVGILVIALAVVVVVLVPIGISSFFKTGGQKILGVTVYFLILAALLYSGLLYMSSRTRQYYYRECQQNLSGVGAELKIYAADNDGLFPDNLKQMDPGIMGRTYSHGGDAVGFYPEYEVSADNREYTLFCNRKVHGEPANYPQYTSRCGLIAP